MGDLSEATDSFKLWLSWERPSMDNASGYSPQQK